MIGLMDKILPEDVGKPQTGSTQEHLPIQAIHDDVVILKDGSAAMVLQTTAVNFDLLSENEQLAIISSFAQLLNSLSFSIQIVIRSKRLDISHYLEMIKKIEEAQTNPLLKEMTKRYRVFVETLTSENQVLDKQFYLVIPVSYLEIGLINNIEKDLKKAITLLIPRRDHIIKQLARIGLKANQLMTDKLIKLYYDFYNETTTQLDIKAFIDKTVSLKTPSAARATPSPNHLPVEGEGPKPEPKSDEVKIVDLDQHPTPGREKPNIDPHHMETRTSEAETAQVHPPVGPAAPAQPKPRPATPFVVEELQDE